MLRWLTNRGGFSAYGQFMRNACGGLCAMLVEGLNHVSIGAKQDKVLVAQ